MLFKSFVSSLIFLSIYSITSWKRSLKTSKYDCRSISVLSVFAFVYFDALLLSDHTVWTVMFSWLIDLLLLQYHSWFLKILFVSKFTSPDMWKYRHISFLMLSVYMVYLSPYFQPFRDIFEVSLVNITQLSFIYFF